MYNVIHNGFIKSTSENFAGATNIAWGMARKAVEGTRNRVIRITPEGDLQVVDGCALHHTFKIRTGGAA